MATNSRSAEAEVEFTPYTQEAFEKNKKDIVNGLKEKLEAALKLLEDTDEDLNGCVYNTVNLIKDEIDIRTESLKADLDIFRDTLFDQLDKRQNELLKSFVPEKLKKAKNDLKGFQECQPLEEWDDFTKMQTALKGTIYNIQECFDFTFEMKYQESTYKFGKNPIGEIIFELNKFLPDSNWEYKCEVFNESKFQVLHTLKCENTVNAVKYIGSDMLVSSSDDLKVQLWDVKSGQSVKTLENNAIAQKFFLFGEDKFGASLVRPARIKIWDSKNLESAETKLDSSVESLVQLQKTQFAVGQIGDNAVNSFGDYTRHKIVFYQLNGLRLQRTGEISYAHDDSIECLLPLPNDLLASASDDTKIKIWNLSDKKMKKTLDGHSDWVTELKMLPGNVLCSGSMDMTIRIWNYETGKCLKKLKSTGAIDAMVLLPTGFLLTLVENGQKRSVSVLEARHLKHVATIQVKSIHGDDYMRTIEYIDDLCFASANGKQIRIFDFKKDPRK